MRSGNPESGPGDTQMKSVSEEVDSAKDWAD
jgi:hypothetical protein